MKLFLTTALLAAALTSPVLAEEVLVPIPMSNWWHDFQHPGLTAAIEQGLSAHPDMASALARIQAAEAGIAMARSGRRPEFNVDAGYRWGREETVRTGGVEDDIEPLFGSARLSWEVDLFSRWGAGIDAATARAGQSEADRAGVRLLLSIETARAYIDVARLNEQALFNQDEVEDAQAIHQRAERRARAGLEPDTAHALALAEWQEAEHRLMQTEIDLDRARSRLTSLVGGTPVEGEAASLAGFALPAQPDLAGEDRVMRRPDVVKAHLGWLEARGEAKASSRVRWPSLAVVVSAAGDGEDAGDPESWWAWAGPVISFPVWNPGLKAKSTQARAREEAAESTFRAVSLRAVEEIDGAWAERARSEDMTGHMQARREALASVAEAETRKRAAGLVQEDTLRRAELDAVEAARAELAWRAAALHAHLTLIAALGG
jgi:outer membrane protein TolC